MPYIDIADKTTLDSVKTLIGTANPTATTKDTVMNMLNKIDSKIVTSGTDFSLYKKPITKRATVTLIANSGIDVLTIYGDGYLDSIYFKLGNASAPTSFSVFIDGQSIFDMDITGSTSTVNGLVQSNKVISNTSSYALYPQITTDTSAPVALSTNLYGLPSTDSTGTSVTGAGVVILPQPIYFKNNFRIYFGNDYASASQTINYAYCYTLK